MNELLHIGVIVEQRYRAQSQPAGLVAAMLKRGHRVSVIDPQAASCEIGDDGWLAGLDLIVGRGRSCSLLCLLGWAATHGIPTINTNASIAAVHNKAEMAVALSAGRVPMPRTFFTSLERLAQEVTREDYPLIVKPIFGDNCSGLRVVNSADEMRHLEWHEPVALAQRFIANDGYDLKLYGIGDTIWAVRKPSPLNTERKTCDGHAAELLPLTEGLARLARRCSELFGLELFGVDCIETADGALVIEINDFPNYTGVPGASERLADYVIRRAKKERAS